jgi:hypothetical protein
MVVAIDEELDTHQRAVNQVDLQRELPPGLTFVLPVEFVPQPKTFSISNDLLNLER